MKMENKKELRLCEVNGELGYFHIWEQYSSVVELRYMHGSGQYSRIFGIVEFKDAIKRIDPTNIKFCDEAHEVLTIMANAKNKKGE